MEIQENENQVCITPTGRQSWHGEISAKLIQLRDVDRFFHYIYGVLHSLLHSRVNLSVLDRSSPQACHFETCQWWWSSEDIFQSCSATTLVCYRLYSAMDWFLTHVSWNMVTIAWLFFAPFFPSEMNYKGHHSLWKMEVSMRSLKHLVLYLDRYCI